LQEKIETLVSANATLQEELSLGESEIFPVNEEFNLLFQRALRLQQMNAVITIREICEALEWRICMKAAGSKTRAKRGRQTFRKIQQSADMEAKGSLEAVMASLELLEGTIDNVKEYGNAAVHDNRSILKPRKIREILAQDESDEIDTQQHDAFVAALYELEMVLEDGTVNATKA
jgi:hypothetical protein